MSISEKSLGVVGGLRRAANDDPSSDGPDAKPPRKGPGAALAGWARGLMRGPGDIASEVTQAGSSSDLMKSSWQGVKGHLGLIVAFSAFINLLYLAPSLFMLQVYDRVVPTQGLLTLILLGIVLAAALVVLASLDALRGRLLARISLRIERLAASPVVREVMAARRAGAAPGGGSIRDLDTLRQGISSPATIGLLDLPWTPLFIIVSFIIHFWIGVLATAGAVLIFGLALINERVSRANLTALTQKSPRFYVAHESDLNAAETIHAIGAEPAITRKRLAVRNEMVDAQTDSAFDNASYSAITKAFRLFLQSASLGLGAYLAIQREISPGAIIAASILTARAFAPVEQIVGGWRQVGMAASAFQTLRKLFESANADAERTPLPAPKGNINVQQISASPPGAQALALMGVSFQAAPGEIIGIIGPSGAGKSTLARVLANAAVPSAGAIRIEGARYSDWDQVALARHIGYMPQRIDLFDGTVADNISCFARSLGASMDEVGPRVVRAAQLAGAHELILGLPQGYETQLGFGGAGVSPGQAQRIALTRAFYDDPCVVVLDEPNSHLDSEGEAALVKALEAVKARGAVCFVVAHRAGVISIVDKILVLQEGRLTEFGPRDAVLAKMAGRAPQPQPPGPAAGPRPGPQAVVQEFGGRKPT
jgi:ATP-binding cassette subfamily C protein